MGSAEQLQFDFSDDGLVGSTTVATWLGMSREQVWRLWRNGSLPGFRLDRNLRFSPDDVRAFCAARYGTGNATSAPTRPTAAPQRAHRPKDGSDYHPI